ncbi:hypothetical protein TRICI_002152 [Trichomonascus ciferrii]|uniref:Enhancer of translation termination 1 n=1 Tax=Trichomonascus ciferrii TaxID=44093 RepID=A0A642V7H9_9ASCO|nr:hypothetical protein TRICI_002152 [Trichomonascus ciferrii]
MVKRPQGLNKSSKSKKKQRVTSELPSGNGGEPEQVTIELDHEVDPDDELGQLNALYDTFVNSPVDNNGFKSPKLLYGVIHECDRLLRNATGALPSRFHNVYALSLLELSKFHVSEGEKRSQQSEQQDEDMPVDTTEAYIEAAIDRADVGLAADEKSPDLLFTRAKAEIALISVKINDVTLTPGVRYMVAVEMIENIQKAIKDYEVAESIILDSPESDANKKKGCLYTKDQLDTIESLLKIAENFNSLEYEREIAPFETNSDPAFEKVDGPLLAEQQRKLAEWSKKRWEQILEKVPEGKGKGKTPEEDGDHSYAVIRRANRGMGEYYLSISAPIISRLEASDDDDGDDDDDDDDDEEVTEEKLNDFQTAKGLLTKAIEYLLKAEHDSEHDAAVYPLIAEAQISLANLLDNDSDEQNVLYNEAVARLKKAQRLGYGDYQEQIAELEL